LRETAEMACDALAIGTNPECRSEYAELLLEHSTLLSGGEPTPILTVNSGAPASFERRLSMILSERVSGDLSVWGVLAATGFALLALPHWSLAEPENEEPLSVQSHARAKSADSRTSADARSTSSADAARANTVPGPRVPGPSVGSTRQLIRGRHVRSPDQVGERQRQRVADVAAGRIRRRSSDDSIDGKRDATATANTSADAAPVRAVPSVEP
jgi:hypothetical protein